MVLHKDGTTHRIKASDHTNHSGSDKKWIQGAIKHPGAEKNAAKKAGVSTHSYMEEHKGDSGKAGSRARLGLTLENMGKSHKLGGTPQAHSGDGMKVENTKPKISYKSEPDGDETKMETKKPTDIKATPTKTVTKGYKADSPTNIPRSANLEDHPVVKAGQPALPAGVVEGSGSKTTAGDPSFSPIASSNSAADPGVHIHVHMNQEK